MPITVTTPIITKPRKTKHVTSTPSTSKQHVGHARSGSTRAPGSHIRAPKAPHAPRAHHASTHTHGTYHGAHDQKPYAPVIPVITIADMTATEQANLDAMHATGSSQDITGALAGLAAAGTGASSSSTHHSGSTRVHTGGTGRTRGSGGHVHTGHSGGHVHHSPPAHVKPPKPPKVTAPLQLTDAGLLGHDSHVTSTATLANIAPTVRRRPH